MIEAEGMPSIQDFPQVEHPGGELPSIPDDFSEVPDSVLSENIKIYSSWNAAAETAAGVYAAAEEAYKQDLAHIRRKVYIEYHEQGKFKKEDLKDLRSYKVEEDERVYDAQMKYDAMRVSHITFKSYAGSYEKMLLLYMSERKHRREYAVNGKSPNGESLG